MMQNYLNLFNQSLRLTIDKYPPNFIQYNDFDNGLKLLFKYNDNYQQQMALIIVFAIIMTIIRKPLWTNFIRNILIKNGYVSARKERKFIESGWAFSFYSLTTIIAFYIIQNNDFLNDPSRIFADFKIEQPIPSTIKYLYWMEIGFYIHSIYAVYFINSWKYDSLVMIIHHAVTLFLLLFSYWARVYNVGVVVIYFHDICDVILEGSKCLVCLKFSLIKYLESKIRIINLIWFIVAWFYYRIYLFPMIALMESIKFINTTLTNDLLTFVYGLFIFLWIIYCLNIFWAMLIINLIINSVWRKNRKIDDPRDSDGEDDDDEMVDNNSNKNKKD
ncbi:Ceramide synthase 1 [Dermatophagoides pteronyssinus]|uniref:Ceramide synthase 1 n=1 Tax=Dermatophagoides pteronyssinus TaxID=6956 RepID=A0ABQ8JTI8_DERPT|nr:Ceramide synthase 1 [Dermatophagoides pteronyssinus]